MGLFGKLRKSEENDSKNRIFDKFCNFYEEENYQAQLDIFDNVFPEKNEAYFFNKGIVYQNLRQFGNAAESYEKTCEINPTNAEANYRMGQCCFYASELSSAEICFTNTIELEEMSDEFEWKDACLFYLSLIQHFVYEKTNDVNYLIIRNNILEELRKKTWFNNNEKPLIDYFQENMEEVLLLLEPSKE